MNTANILLVDDEVAFVEAMVKRLTKRGYDVSFAHSGQDALQILRDNKRIEVVVLDIRMPGLDGIETLQAIKKDFPRTEVILLTGHATVETAVQGMKMGARDYLLKPCDFDELILKVNQAADIKRSADAAKLDEKIKEISSKFG